MARAENKRMADYGVTPKPAAERNNLILVPAGFLILGILPMSYAFYGSLRAVVFMGACLLIEKEYKRNNSFNGMAMAFCAVAALFNPIIPQEMSRASWFFIDLAAAGLFWFAWRKSEKTFADVPGPAIASHGDRAQDLIGSYGRSGMKREDRIKPYATGVATIRHSTTGIDYEIEAEKLKWKAVFVEDEAMGKKTHYEAEIEHEQLGRLDWNLWEYPVGVENGRETHIWPHTIVEDLDYGLKHVPDHDENE